MRNFPNQFQRVVDYLKAFQVEVSLSTSTCYIKTDNQQTIYIHHNYNLEKNGLIALLHEAGHVLQDDSEYGPNHYKRVDDMERPKAFNMYQFMNEVDAWNRGEELIRMLDLDVDSKRFHQQREEALLTYYV